MELRFGSHGTLPAPFGGSMELPYRSLAYVERDKVCNYLLNELHPRGAAKARFFRQFGFRPDQWEVLADALVGHSRGHAVTARTETTFGVRYEIDGDLIAPDGRRPLVRTVWHVTLQEIAPRLITAYPLPRPY